jgi:hypothetical protein
MLIDQTTSWWNLDLVRRLFNPGDVARIGSVMLSLLKQVHKHIWRGFTLGIFSVRCAYHMEMRRLAQERGECSGVKDLSELWKTIWGLNAPPVLKNFSWKVCNNILLAKENLFRKKIVADPWCPFYHIEPGTIYHCLWGCLAAIAVW